MGHGSRKYELVRNIVQVGLNRELFIFLFFKLFKMDFFFTFFNFKLNQQNITVNL